MSWLASDFNYEDFFNQDILTLLGLEALSDEEKAEQYQKMLQTVENRVLERVIRSLESEALEHFKQLIDSGSDEELGKFMASQRIDLAKIVAEEALAYKIEISTLADALFKKG